MLTQSSAAVMVALMSFTEEDEQGLFTRKREKKITCFSSTFKT